MLNRTATLQVRSSLFVISVGLLFALTIAASAQVHRNGSRLLVSENRHKSPPPTVTCGSGTDNWTGTAGDNQWSTAGNWSSGVPVSTSGVCIASTFTSTIAIGTLAAANQTISSLTSGATLSLTTGPLTISGAATFADLKVSSGTLTLNGASSLTTLELSGGTLSGTGTQTITGLLTWSGGTMSGAGTTNAKGGIALSGEPFLDTRTLNNSATATWSGIEFLMLNGSIFNNLTGATWNHTVDTQIAFDGGNPPTFSNAGTFKKTGGTSTSGGGVTSSIVFNNSGAVQANTGLLFFSDVGSCTGVCSGTWSVAAGATLQLGSGGTAALNGSISGAGTVNFGSSGTLNYTGTYNITGGTTESGTIVNFTSPATVTATGPLTVTTGTLNLSTGKAISVSTITQSAGTLTGTDALTITGLLTWSGGTMSGAGTTNAKGGIALSGEPFLDTRTFNNSATATWSGIEFLMLNGSIFNNLTGATWNHTVDTQIAFDGGNPPTFSNAGTFKKTGGTSTSGGGVTSSIVFNNSGAVQANTGLLFFSDVGSCTGVCSGTWSVAAGATLQLGSGGTAALNGSISGAGTVNFGSSGTLNYTGTYNITGGTTESGTIVNFTSPATVTATGPLTVTTGTLNLSTGKAISVSTITQSAGTLTGTDALTITGLLTWSGGTMSGAGTTNAKGGIALSGEPFLDTRTFNNSATATWSGIEFLMLNGSIFNNLTGATWNHTVDTQIAFDGGNPPTFSNAGTFEKTGGTSTSGGGVTSSIVFNNSGAVQANTGLLFFSDVGSCTGVCSGTWSVAAGATLELGSGGTAALNGKISGAGIVNFGSSGTVNYTGTYDITGGTTESGTIVNFTSPATVTATGPLTVTTGTLNFSTGKAVSATTMTQSAGTLTGTDTLTLTGLLTWSGGTESGAGITDANGGMTITGEPFLDTRTINNKKTATWSGIEFLMLNGSIFNNLAGATWNHTVDTQIAFDGGNTPTFSNAGTFEKTGGTTTSGGGVTSSIVFNNTGTVIAQSGVLLLGSSYTQTKGSTLLEGGTILMSGTSPLAEQAGSVLGSGTITGDVTNTAGLLSPSLSSPKVTTGSLAISGSGVGNYTQGQAARCSSTLREAPQESSTR